MNYLKAFFGLLWTAIGLWLISDIWKYILSAVLVYAGMLIFFNALGEE